MSLGPLLGRGTGHTDFQYSTGALVCQAGTLTLREPASGGPPAPWATSVPIEGAALHTSYAGGFS